MLIILHRIDAPGAVDNFPAGETDTGDTIRKPLMAQTFSVTVLVYEDGTLAVTDSDITGLIIKVRTCDELLLTYCG